MSDAIEKMRARLAALRKTPPTGRGGEPGSRAPADSPAKPPDAAGRVADSSPAPAVRGGTAAPAPSPSPFELPASPAPRAGGERSPKRSLTLSRKQIEREARTEAEKAERLQLAPEPPPDVEAERPKTRGDCFGGPRPCPFVGCRYHTYLDATPIGSLVINRPDVDVAEMKASCALDIADDGPKTLEQVGAVMNVTRERMRQLETATLRKVKRLVDQKPDGEVTFRKQCKAVDAFTGRRCGLLEHQGAVHRSERGEFRVVAAEGQTRFALKERLDEQATRNPESVPALEAANV